MQLRTLVPGGAVLTMALGLLHAAHAMRADDVESYLLIATLFLIGQGVLTWKLLRRSAGSATRGQAP